MAACHKAASMGRSERRNSDETDAFLASAPAASFPPDAFNLPSDLYDTLAALPEFVSEHADERTKLLANPATLLCIMPFPQLFQHQPKDYIGRTIEESLDAVRLLCGLPLPLADSNQGAPTVFLGRAFLNTFLRGGYQGAAYFVDTIR